MQPSGNPSVLGEDEGNEKARVTMRNGHGLSPSATPYNASPPARREYNKPGRHEEVS